MIDLGPRPLRLIINTRISDLRPEDIDDAGRSPYGPGLATQEEDCRRCAEAVGRRVGRPVEIVKVIVEPNISAYKRRKITLPDGTTAMRVYRPGLRETLRMLTAKEADGAIWLDLDRAMRDPRDLEDLIDVVTMTRPRPIVDSVTGSLSLANDSGIAMARIMCVVGAKSSADTSRRVSRRRLQLAENGRFGGGRRPYGFEKDGGTLRPTEAGIIFKWGEDVLGGVSLRGLAADARQQRIMGVTGQPLTAPTIRDILLRPRNAGLMVHRPLSVGRSHSYTDDDIIGPAPWDAIMPEEMWRAVAAKLTDPNRRTNPGRAPQWLGSGLYTCSACGGTLRVSTSSSRKTRPTYRCLATGKTTRHVSRFVGRLDAFVEDVVIERLSRPDAIDLIASAPDVDARALRAEIAVLRTRLDDLAEDYADAVITRAQLRAGSTRINEAVADLERQLSNAVSPSPLTALVGSDDVAALWSTMPLSARRVVLAELMTVIIMPTGPGRRQFDRDSVRIVWHDQQPLVEQMAA